MDKPQIQKRTKQLLEKAEKPGEFTEDLEIKNLYVVANKIRDPDESRFITQNLDVFHQLPYSEEVSKASMSGDFQIVEYHIKRIFG
ncbi:MAG: hypothetical protein KAU03_05455 [Candidatus Altiarchaeales archaeon]|nr:hypothetical protein [Candidatus Altiarchaeales archaeon]